MEKIALSTLRKVSSLVKNTSTFCCCICCAMPPRISTCSKMAIWLPFLREPEGHPQNAPRPPERDEASNKGESSRDHGDNPNHLIRPRILMTVGTSTHQEPKPALFPVLSEVKKRQIVCVEYICYHPPTKNTVTYMCF